MKIVLAPRVEREVFPVRWRTAVVDVNATGTVQRREQSFKLSLTKVSGEMTRIVFECDRLAEASRENTIDVELLLGPREPKHIAVALNSVDVDDRKPPPADQEGEPALGHAA